MCWNRRYSPWFRDAEVAAKAYAEVPIVGRRMVHPDKRVCMAGALAMDELLGKAASGHTPPVSVIVQRKPVLPPDSPPWCVFWEGFRGQVGSGAVYVICPSWKGRP